MRRIQPRQAGSLKLRAIQLVKPSKIAVTRQTPPIKKLTFHSMRKIASYDLSKKLSNPMLLSRVTGHKTIQVLNDRYYEVNVEDLRDMLQELDTDNTRLKGILVLLKLMGHEKASEFIHFVRTAEIQNPTNMIAELKN